MTDGRRHAKPVSPKPAHGVVNWVSWTAQPKLAGLRLRSLDLLPLGPSGSVGARNAPFAPGMGAAWVRGKEACERMARTTPKQQKDEGLKGVGCPGGPEEAG